MSVKFASWDGDPLVWTPRRAFVFRDGAWLEVSSADPGMEARVLDEASFKSRFGELPPSPITTAHP